MVCRFFSKFLFSPWIKLTNLKDELPVRNEHIRRMTFLKTSLPNDFSSIFERLPNLSELCVENAGTRFESFDTASSSFREFFVSSNLKRIDITFMNRYDPKQYDTFLSILKQMRHLESIRLENFEPEPAQLKLFEETVANLPNLLELDVELYYQDADQYPRYDLFAVSVLQKTRLVKLYVRSRTGYTFEEDMFTDIPLEQLQKILKSNQLSLSTLSLPFERMPTTEDIQALAPSFVGTGMKSCDFCPFDRDRGEKSLQWLRETEIWDQLTQDASNLLKCTRLLSSFRFKVGARLPVELVERILTSDMLESNLWFDEKLKTIIRCLKNRETIGLVHSEVVELDANVLYVKCARALDRIKPVTRRSGRTKQK